MMGQAKGLIFKSPERSFTILKDPLGPIIALHIHTFAEVSGTILQNLMYPHFHCKHNFRMSFHNVHNNVPMSLDLSQETQCEANPKIIFFL